MKNKAALTAVHDDDLEGFLRGLGVLEDVRAARTRCKFCRDSLSLTNLAAVFPDSGDIKFVCDKPQCVNSLAQYRAETRGQDTLAAPADPDSAAEGSEAPRSANG